MIETDADRPDRAPRAWWPALLAALGGTALYAISLGGTYVYDDWDVLGLDERLTHVGQWWRYWTESYNGGVDNLYRPLVSMTYAAQWWLHGIGEGRAWIFHAVNIAMYAGVCALVAELARRLAPAPQAVATAIIAGVLFAAHPLHVEAAAYIVGRAELMAALGAVGAMVLLLRRPMSAGRAIAIVACFVLSVLSKEQGMLVPLLLLLLWACARRGTGADREIEPLPGRERRACLVLALLLAWGLAGYIILRENLLKFWWDRSFLDPTIQPMILSHGRDRWLMPLALLGRYTQLLIVPWKLSPDYGGKVIGSAVDLHDPYLYLGGVALLTWLALTAWSFRRRANAELFCLLGLAATYAVVGNIFTLIGTNFGERLLFLPSVFFVLLIALLLARLPRAPMIGIVLVLVVLGSVRTVTYAARWNDRLRFYEISSRQQPNSIRLKMLLAHELMERGRYDDALAVAARGRALMPDYPDIWIQSAVIAMNAGHYDQAEQFLQRSLKIKPTIKALGWQQKLAELRKAATAPSTQSGHLK